MVVDDAAGPLAASPEALPSDGHTTLVRRQIRGSSLLLTGQFLALALSFATQVLVVRYLSKTGYGAFAYALSFVAIAQTLTTFGATRAVARIVPIFRERGDPASARHAITAAFAIMVALGSSLVLLAVGLQGVVGPTLIRDQTARTIVLILIALAPIQAVDDLMMNLFAVFHRVRSIFGRTYLLAPFLRLCAAIGMIATGGTAKTLAVGYVVAAMAGLVVYGRMLLRVLREENLAPRLPRGGERLSVAPVLSLAAPLFAADIAYVVMISADALLLGHFRGPTEVAAFKAVQPAARLNEMVFGTFLMLFTPLASRLFARNDRAGLSDLYWQTAAWITVLSFPIFALTFALADPLVTLLFGARYSGSGVYLAILSVGFYVQAAFGFNGTTLMVFGRTKYIVVLAFLATATNLGLNLLLIPAYGALGAAIGTATSLALYNVFKQIALRMATGVPMLARGYAGLYINVAAVAGCIVAVQRGLNLSLVPSLTVACVGSLVILATNRGRLRTATTFPELRRFPLAARVMGLGGGS